MGPKSKGYTHGRSGKGGQLTPRRNTRDMRQGERKGNITTYSNTPNPFLVGRTPICDVSSSFYQKRRGQRNKRELRKQDNSPQRGAQDCKKHKKKTPIKAHSCGETVQTNRLERNSHGHHPNKPERLTSCGKLRERKAQKEKTSKNKDKTSIRG